MSAEVSGAPQSSTARMAIVPDLIALQTADHLRGWSAHTVNEVATGFTHLLMGVPRGTAHQLVQNADFLGAWHRWAADTKTQITMRTAAGDQIHLHWHASDSQWIDIILFDQADMQRAEEALDWAVGRSKERNEALWRQLVTSITLPVDPYLLNGALQFIGDMHAFPILDGKPSDDPAHYIREVCVIGVENPAEPGKPHRLWRRSIGHPPR